MNKIKNIIVLTVCLMAGVAFGATTSDATSKDINSLFKANEFSLTLASAVNLKGDYDANFSVGAAYFFTQKIGFQAALPIYDTRGQIFESANAGLVFRYPVAKIFSPFVQAGGIYNWQSQTTAGYAGGGLEIRPFNSKWGVSVGSNYNYEKFDTHGTWQPFCALRLVF